MLPYSPSTLHPRKSLINRSASFLELRVIAPVPIDEPDSSKWTWTFVKAYWEKSSCNDVKIITSFLRICYTSKSSVVMFSLRLEISTLHGPEDREIRVVFFPPYISSNPLWSHFPLTLVLFFLIIPVLTEWREPRFVVPPPLPRWFFFSLIMSSSARFTSLTILFLKVCNMNTKHQSN